MPPQVHKGRGATLNPDGRFERHRREAVDDGWGSLDELADDPAPATAGPARPGAHDHRPQQFARHPVRPVDQPLPRLRAWLRLLLRAPQPRPSRALGGARLRDQDLRQARRGGTAARRSWRGPAMSASRSRWAPTPTPTSRWSAGCGSPAQVLEVLAETRHPVGIVTKSALVTRDIDLLAPMARAGPRPRLRLGHHARRPRSPARWSRAPRHRTGGSPRSAQLAAAGVTTGVMVAPIIPALTDHEIEPILAAAAEAGAVSAGWVLVRLPHEVKDLMAAWLEAHCPRPRRACPVADPPMPRRPAQRPRVRQPDARRRPLRRADRASASRRPAAATASTAARCRSAPTCSARRGWTGRWTCSAERRGCTRAIALCRVE